MTDVRATVGRKKGVNPIWLVPIVALLIGLWMVIYTLQSEGPEITITFSTAEGIEENKTKIKFRNVDIGIVEDVRLGDDLKSVVVTASLDKEAEALLLEDTQFWVVRPRVGKAGVSGLSTLLSGGYIQLAPGETENEGRDFIGLEMPPVTPAGTPGVGIVLTADRAGSVSAGDPVLFKGYTVGYVENETFDIEHQLLRYDVFIHAPYDEKLTDRHRFWDISGISARAGADGIEVDVPALETLLIGGVEVGLPTGVSPGTPVEAGAEFRLYGDFNQVNQRPHRESVEYVVQFPQSIRGLRPGAPVEYRGIPVGEVEEIMLSAIATGEGTGVAIPILIRVEPARIRVEDTPEGVERFKLAIENAVGNGLRASLATGNLLTGSLFVALDMYPDDKKRSLGEFAGRPTIPTIPSGLEGVLQKVTKFLDKLNDLPLQGTVAEAKNLLASVDALVGSQDMQRLPEALDRVLVELRATLASVSSDSELQSRLLPAISELELTLQSLRQVLDTLEQQPNALIFNRKVGDDPRPPAGSQ